MKTDTTIRSAKTFRVVGFSDGAFSIPNGFPTVREDRPTGEHVLTLKSEYETDPLGYVIHKRVRATVDLPAPNLDDAIGIGLGLAEGALSVAAFVTGASSGFVEPWVAYETTPGIAERAFRQFIQPGKGLPEKATRSVPVDQFREVYISKAELDPRRRLAASNAMFWFDRACDESKPVHRYQAMWLAMEALDPALREEFQSEPDYDKCSKCGKRYKRPTIIGVRDLFRSIQNKIGLSFSKARDVRVVIFHATDTLFEANEKARAHVEQLEAALAHGICRVLSLQDEASLTQRDIPLPSRIPYFAILDGVLHGADPSSLGVNGEEPHYQFVPFGSPASEAPASQSAKSMRFGTISHVSVPANLSPPLFPEELNVQKVVVDGEAMRGD